MSPAGLSVTGQSNGLWKLKRDVFGTMVQNVTQYADGRGSNHGLCRARNRQLNQGHSEFLVIRSTSWREICFILASMLCAPPALGSVIWLVDGFCRMRKLCQRRCVAISNTLIRSTGGIRGCVTGIRAAVASGRSGPRGSFSASQFDLHCR